MAKVEGQLLVAMYNGSYETVEEGVIKLEVSMNDYPLSFK